MNDIVDGITGVDKINEKLHHLEMLVWIAIVLAAVSLFVHLIPGDRKK